MSEDKNQLPELVDRRTLTQVNATIIAGMLIFLSLNDSIPLEPIKSIIVLMIVFGFASLVISIGFCIATKKYGTNPSLKQLQTNLTRNFELAEIFFFLGITLLLAVVTLMLVSIFYST